MRQGLQSHPSPGTKREQPGVECDEPALYSGGISQPDRLCTPGNPGCNLFQRHHRWFSGRNPRRIRADCRAGQEGEIYHPVYLYLLSTNRDQSCFDGRSHSGSGKVPLASGTSGYPVGDPGGTAESLYRQDAESARRWGWPQWSRVALRPYGFK